jgi:hypothetical protein
MMLDGLKHDPRRVFGNFKKEHCILFNDKQRVKTFGLSPIESNIVPKTE